MAFKLACPSCSRKLSVDFRQLLGTTSCRGCGYLVTVWRQPIFVLGIVLVLVCAMGFLIRIILISKGTHHSQHAVTLSTVPATPVPISDTSFVSPETQAFIDRPLPETPLEAEKRVKYTAERRYEQRSNIIKAMIRSRERIRTMLDASKLGGDIRVRDDYSLTEGKVTLVIIITLLSGDARDSYETGRLRRNVYPEVTRIYKRTLEEYGFANVSSTIRTDL